jgi:hypothetical protein
MSKQSYTPNTANRQQFCLVTWPDKIEFDFDDHHQRLHKIAGDQGKVSQITVLCAFSIFSDLWKSWGMLSL